MEEYTSKTWREPEPDKGPPTSKEGIGLDSNGDDDSEEQVSSEESIEAEEIQKLRLISYDKFMELKLGKMKLKIFETEAKKGKQKDKTIRHQIEEKDYLVGESIEISEDVFNLTIAANLTKEVPPMVLIYCIR